MIQVTDTQIICITIARNHIGFFDQAKAPNVHALMLIRVAVLQIPEHLFIVISGESTWY